METQISDIVGFMDALSMARATFIGHSSGGGKITQLAQRYPGRVHRLIYLDTVFRYVAPGLEEKMDAGIARAAGGHSMDSLDLWKRTARMWELGAWSPAMDRHLEEILTIESDGRLRFRHADPPNWRQEVDRDMEAGLYFDTRIVHPALMIFAMDTDHDRAKQLDRQVRKQLSPLIAATEERRKAEIRAFRANGSHIRVVELRHTAHYCFVHRPDEVSRLILSFLMSGKR
jgi:pimeloyl-ACP methyl ester carboxylesterase